MPTTATKKALPRSTVINSGTDRKYYTEPEYKCPFDHTPNAETLAAFAEGDAMLCGEIPSQTFQTFEELWKDLNT